MQHLSTAIFGLAIAHTFLVAKYRHLGSRFRKGSPAEKLFHLLGEVEVIFGFWAAVFLFIWAIAAGADAPLSYLEGINFTEAVFVFVIMTVSSTKPVLDVAGKLMEILSRSIPISRTVALAATILSVGPLLGSFITEPAAMTVCALLLLPVFSSPALTSRTKYLLLGLLFVNISIGGTLTHFAAPPVLMVARVWGWNTAFMLEHIGWRAVIAVVISTIAVVFQARGELAAVELKEERRGFSPLWVTIIHLLFIGLVVLSAHHVVMLFALFLFFLGWITVSSEYQQELPLGPSLLVGFFLAGLVTLGGLQEWWITPLIRDLSGYLLFWGATGLTAISDNALLTYLGTLVPELTECQKISLVTGAVCGGGLSVIANAPNPIGFSLLGKAFGENGIEPGKLFLGAILPTLIAAALFLI